MRLRLGVVVLVWVVFFMWDGNVEAADWTKLNTGMEVAYVAVAVADAFTTADIRHHDNLEEVQPVARALLGRNPEPVPTALYFAGTMAIHYGISRVLPRGAREVWQATTIVVNGSIVANNYQLGLRFGF